MNTIVIGLGFEMRNGKDTVARFIHEKYGREFGGPYDIVVRPLAAALKRKVNAFAEQHGGFQTFMAALQSSPKAFGYYGGELPEWVVLDKDPDMTDPYCPLGKHRKVLQFFGTEAGRHNDPFMWIMALSAYMQERQPQFLLVPDLRFRNEMAWVRSVGGDTVWVNRSDFKTDDAQAKRHVSETELVGAKFDYELHCEDNLDELRRLSHELFEHIVESRNFVPMSSPLVNVRHFEPTTA